MVVTPATTPFTTPLIFKYHAIKSPNQYSLSILSPPTTNFIRRRILLPHTTGNRPVSATPNRVFLLSEATPAEKSDQIVSAAGNGDGVSVVISVLLSIAFVSLSVLTIGVIYIAVTDYLQNREKDKFEKEAAEKAKRGGKKKRVRSRAGPKGFGQKINDDNYDDL